MSASVEDPKLLGQRLLQRAWNRDGLVEIAIGLTFLMASGLIYASEVLPKRSAGQVAAILAFSFGLPALMWSTRTVIRMARRRWLVPRSGFVEYLPIRYKPSLRALLIGVAVVIPVIPIIIFGSGSLLVPYTGLLSALLAFEIGRRGRMARTMALALVVAATAIVLAFVGFDMEFGFAILWGSQGVLWLISGAVVFARFLHEPMENTDAN